MLRALKRLTNKQSLYYGFRVDALPADSVLNPSPDRATSRRPFFATPLRYIGLTLIVPSAS